MTAAYPIAALPEPYRILGQRLKPLCMGHFLNMERFSVAFVSPETQGAALEDLVMAVAICSMSYDGFLEFIEEPDWMEQITAWGARCGMFDFVEKVQLFQKYLKEGSKQPAVSYEGETKNTGAHWVQCIQTGLIELGYTPAEAMNMPLTKAFADFYKYAERNGAVTILTERQAAALEADEPEGVVCQG